MKLSVIIPNYNSSQTILTTIESIIAQNYPVTEIIVVDDASTDDSVELIRHTYSKTKIIANSRNHGAAYSRNVGIANAKGDLVLFVDSDVSLGKGLISTLITNVSRADILYPRIEYANSMSMYPNSKNDEAYLLISPIFLITKGALNKLNGSYFDEHYRIYGEDTDFFLRCKLLGLTCLYVSDSVAVHIVNKPQYREERYFLEVRNTIYGAVKFRGIKNINELDHAFKFTNIAKLYLCGCFNFNLFDAQAAGFDKSKGDLYKALALFRSHNKLTPKNILFRLSLTIHAIMSALPLIPIACRARRNLKLLTNGHSRV